MMGDTSARQQREAARLFTGAAQVCETAAMRRAER
jgi:hypothetical protein